MIPFHELSRNAQEKAKRHSALGHTVLARPHANGHLIYGVDNEIDLARLLSHGWGWQVVEFPAVKQSPPERGGEGG